jgi:tRNA nucleotidyltransferase (CCA-adding enzyme)
MGRTESGEAKRAISVYFTELKRLRTSLSGKDLKKMGFPPGPLYHEILQALLRERLDGRIQSAEAERAFVHQNYGATISASDSGEANLEFRLSPD